MAIIDANNKAHSEVNGRFVGKTASELKSELEQEFENGELWQDDKGRINIDYCGYMPAFYNKKFNWIVTAMEKWQ